MLQEADSKVRRCQQEARTRAGTRKRETGWTGTVPQYAAGAFQHFGDSLSEERGRSCSAQLAGENELMLISFFCVICIKIQKCSEIVIF